MASSSPRSEGRSRPPFSSFWHRLQTQPLPPTEESVLLRLLVLGMVIVGIVATDVAAETQMSAWAIPLTAIGSGWSWLRRHKRNTLTKFGIAFGMIFALAAFFMGLRGQLNDTRLVLAELLIQLQVLHSFHMPRRQDLGYSMMIGLILIGVASTLSQTMVFGGVLLVFLAIALPVLVLDYRSRLDLGVLSLRSPLKQTGLAPRRLGLFLGGILALGLTLFLLMPRFPGYQLRSFPVSSQIDQNFEDNQQIVNPGYVREGREGTSSGVSGNQGEDGPGEMDTEFYYGFSTRINQNLRGELKPKVVMRVRSQAEGFWRVMAFDQYRGQGWAISRNDATRTIQRPRWSYRFFLPLPITLNERQEVVQTYTIVADLPNIIPALAAPKELYFPTPEVALDAENSLRSPLGLREGFTYTVISEVPYRDRSRLQTAATTYNKTIQQYYLDVPAKLKPRLQQHAEALLATAPNPITNPYEKALFLTQALKQRYTLQGDIPYLNPNEDLVESFFFRHQGGYPDHFSTALTLLLRSIGIPARLAVGFAPGEFNPFTGLYEVKNTDAYALTEVFFPKFGWFAFDPIPGHELIPPSIEKDQTFSTLQRFWQWIAGWLPTPLTTGLSRFFGALFVGIMSFIGWFMALFNQGWAGMLTAIAVLLGLGLLLWLLWQGWQSWRRYRWLNQLPPMERYYQQMLVLLKDRGLSKHPAQTPYEYVKVTAQGGDLDRAGLIARISEAYVQWRYGTATPDLTQVKQALQQLKRLNFRRFQ